jgi:dTDP-4-dehydrorhamnose reductase
MSNVDAEKILVVGADSFLGAKLIQVLEKQQRHVVGTTRRKNTLADHRVFLDLCEDDLNFKAPQGTTYAYLLVGIVNYGKCETDPRAWEVNVKKMTRLAAQLLEQGVFVTFISTNTVFGGERPWCHENASHTPAFAYAKHKSAAELSIREVADKLNALDLLNVVRLTKILGINTSPLPDWFSLLNQGKILNPFTDLIIAPMSLRYTAESLAEIGRHRLSGNLHLSGSENINYNDLAQALVSALGCASTLVTPTTATEMKVEISFKPKFSGIGMERTTNFTGIKPQDLDTVVADLVAQYHLSKKI